MKEIIRQADLQRIIGGIIETLPDAVAVTDERGVIIFANSAAEKILGLARGEIIGRAYSEVSWNIKTLDEKTLPRQEHPFARVLQNKESVYGIEYSVDKPDGARLTISVNAAPLADESGEILGVVASFTDITERKEHEKSLQAALEYAESIVKTVREPLIILNEDLRVRAANPAFYRVFKVTAEETEDKLIFELGNYQWDIPELRELLEKIIPQNSQFEGFEVEHEFPSIGRKIMLLNARKIYRENYEPLILLAIEDATKRRQAEKDLRESKRLSDALNEINAAISATLNFDRIIALVGDKATRILGAETSTVIMRENDYWVVRYNYGLPAELIGKRYRQEQAVLASLIAKQRATIAISDAYTDKRVNNEEMKRLGIRSLIGAPLTVGNVVIGVLYFGHRSKKVSFSDSETDFVMKLAASVSLALEAARAYQGERNIAETLQTSILIMPEKIEGIEFGHLYHSAAEMARVGGDFYDLFELEHGKVGIMLGDVSGKGLEASALTTVVKNTIKAHAYEDGTPAVVISKTNDLVERVSPSSIFVTLFFGVLDTQTGSLIYCNAGHPPALIKRGSSAELLTEYSPIIGAFRDMQYRSGKAALRKGDVLILYSDGVIEARCDSGFYGEERLLEFVSGLEPMPAKQTPRAIINDVLRCTGGKLTDDVAILAVSLRGDSARIASRA